ncbi:MAG: DUF5995 family protein [Halovenus sp.]
MGPGVPAGGRRSKQLRSAVYTIRKRRPTVHGRDGDPELLALVEEPYSTVGEARRRLQELLSAFESRNDRRAVFLSIYTEMTDAVAREVQQGRFADPSWVGGYLVAFANLYREAVHDYEIGDLSSLADPWQLAFQAAERNDSLALQDAMLGVNAHINYDLALAVDEAGVRSDRETKYDDHSRITDVIAAIIDDAQDLLIDDYGAENLETVDELLGQLDERFSVLTIDQCRDSAWRTAVALNSRFGPRRRLARWINDVTSTGAAYIVLSTKKSDRLHNRLVDLER